MAVKSTGDLSFIDALISWKGGGGSLDRLHGLVKWYRFEKLLRDVRDEASPGRPGYPAMVLFKALILQSLYGLSDRALEEALDDRLSFRRFVGLSLDASVPDHTVLNRFRNRLTAEGLPSKLFGELDRQLEAAGVMVKQGTMLDATLVATTSAPPDGSQPGRDPDAGFARRQGKGGFTYGYKAHVGVDRGSGLIRRVVTTAANVNDTTPADGLIVGDEAEIYADAAYHTHRRQAALEARGVKARLMRRPNKHHPKLSPRLRRYNRLIARRRAAVETTFATLKNRMGLKTIRYVGLVKASAQVTLAALAFNLMRWSRITMA